MNVQNVYLAMPKPPQDITVFLSILCGPERHFWVCPPLSHALVQWAVDPRWKENNINLHLSHVSGYPTSQQARNESWRRAREVSADILVMIDNDTIPTRPDNGALVDLFSLVDHCVSRNAIVAAPCPTLKGVHWHVNVYKLDWTGISNNIPEFRPYQLSELVESNSESADSRYGDSLVRVGAVGFGFVAIPGRLVENVADFRYSYGRDGSFEIADQKQSNTPFLRTRALDGSTEVGEDLLFCARASTCGYSIFACMSHFCGHFHTLDYAAIPSIRDTMDNGRAHQVQTQGDASTQGQARAQVENHASDPFSMSDEALFEICSIIRENNIERVLELGSGRSTAVVAQAMREAAVQTTKLPENTTSGLWLLSVEEDGEVAKKTTLKLREIGADNFAHAIHRWDESAGYYRLPSLTNPRFSLVIIDGPSGKWGTRGRITQHLPHWLDLNGAFIVVDDTHRAYEAKIVDQLMQLEGMSLHKKIRESFSQRETIILHYLSNGG